MSDKVKRMGISEAVSCFLVVLLAFSHGCAAAESTVSNQVEEKPDFELQHGDRVVLLGNSLIQNDIEYGYIEYALTTRWPQKDITFRNLGWTGDTVHGEARSYYTSPPDSYDLLIQQLQEAEPTVVFIGYGTNESYGGAEGLSEFKKGMQTLLDEIKKMGAEAVLLSPIPQISGLSPDELSARNEDIRLYASAISEIAFENEIRYIDLFSPFEDYDHPDQLASDGIHLNQKGYYFLASVLEEELGLSVRTWTVDIDFSEQRVDTHGPVEILEDQFNNQNITFTANASILPFPPPATDAAMENKPVIRFKIEGLPEGYYTLKMGAMDIRTASAEKWSDGDGITVKQGI